MVLSSFIWFNWVLPSLPGFYRVQLGFTEFYLVIIGFYRVLHGFHCVLPSFTCFFLLAFTEFCRVGSVNGGDPRNGILMAGDTRTGECNWAEKKRAARYRVVWYGVSESVVVVVVVVLSEDSRDARPLFGPGVPAAAANRFLSSCADAESPRIAQRSVSWDSRQDAGDARPEARRPRQSG